MKHMMGLKALIEFITFTEKIYKWNWAVCQIYQTCETTGADHDEATGTTALCPQWDTELPWAHGDDTTTDGDA